MGDKTVCLTLVLSQLFRLLLLQGVISHAPDSVVPGEQSFLTVFHIQKTCERPLQDQCPDLASPMPSLTSINRVWQRSMSGQLMREKWVNGRLRLGGKGGSTG